MNPICYYCKKESILVFGNEIYPYRPDLFHKKFYLCKPCQAYVGCHPGTDSPLGIIANKELRTLKKIVHSAFDPLWKTKKIRRSYAYQLLCEEMKINPSECHIGMFGIEQCKAAIIAVEKIKQNFS